MSDGNRTAGGDESHGNDHDGRRATRRTLLRSAAALGASAVVVGAVDGTPTNTITDCTTITSPGTYELDRSITPTSVSGDGCIEIDAHDVTLLGGGHALDGRDLTAGTGAAGIRLTSLRRNVEIRNLTVRNWPVGVFYDGETGVVADLTVTDSNVGIYLWNAMDNTVVDSSIARCGRGLQLSADGSVTETMGNAIEHVTLAENDYGAHFGAFTTNGNELTGSCIRDNRIGVETAIRSYDTRVQRNTFLRNAEYGARNRDLTPAEADENYPGEEVRGADVLLATDNYWGTGCGPSSPSDPDAPFTDPVTGAPADGDGDAVSEGITAGQSNVNFDPFRGAPVDGAGRRS